MKKLKPAWLMFLSLLRWDRIYNLEQRENKKKHRKTRA